MSSTSSGFPPRVVFLPLISLLGWAPAAAQTMEHWQVGPWSTAQFGARVVAGQFTPGSELDAVVLDDGTPCLLIAVESFLTRIEAPVVANDIATRPGIGGADTLLSVGPAGLVESTWNAGSGSWSTSTLESSDWVDARRLLVGDLDGAGELDVVALGSASDAIEVLHGTTSGFGTPESFTSAYAAYDLELMDWDGDGVDEIVVLTGWGVEVYDHEGELVAELNLTYSPMMVATIEPAPSTDEERLACVVHEPVDADRQWLFLWSAAGIDGPFFLGDGVGFRSVQSVDWDMDDDLELLLQSTTDDNVVILVNQSGETEEPTFDPTNASWPGEIDLEADPAWNEATLAFGDFDNDGDVDAVAPIQGNYDGGFIGFDDVFSQIQILRNIWEDQTAYWAEVYGVTKTFHVNVPDTQLQLHYSEPAEQLDHDPFNEEVVLQYSVWHLDDVYSAIDEQVFLEGTLDYPDPYSTLTVWLGQTTEDFDDLYAFRVRQVVRDATTHDVLRVGPSHVSVYSADDDDYDDLVAMPWTSGGVAAAAYVEPGGGTGSQGGAVGSGPQVPPSGDGDAPEGSQGPP